jgi:hypothetical protein
MLASLVLLAVLQAEPTAASTALPAARPCSAEEVAALTALVDAPYSLACRAELQGRDIIRPILIEGEEASGAGLDCGGGAIGQPGVQRTTLAPTVGIWSRRIDGVVPQWSRPSDITFRNCRINGNLRVWGMGALGRQSDLLISSRSREHTDRTQEAAPTRIALDNLAFDATGSIPLYVGPGVTNLTLHRGRFGGRSDSTAIYLDAESAETTITGVAFDIQTAREQIAVDGSARNRIADNRFVLRGKGGVFLYRNCGEDGVIRHQTPSNNLIVDNVFSGSTRQSVVIGSREGRRRYCGDDRGWPFGSSIDDGDHATANVIQRNRTVR